MADNLEIKKALAQGLKNIMRTKSFKRITVDDICLEAAVSHRSFYRYFPDKYELLNWIYATEFCDVVSELKIDNMFGLLRYVCDHFYNDRVLYLHAFEVQGQNSFWEFCRGRLYVYLKRDLGDAFENEKLEAFMINHIIDAMFDGFKEWLSSDPCMPPEEFTEMVMDMVTQFSLRFTELALSYKRKSK